MDPTTEQTMTEVDKTLGGRTLTARAEKWFQRKGPPINVTEGELAGGHEVVDTVPARCECVCAVGACCVGVTAGARSLDQTTPPPVGRCSARSVVPDIVCSSVGAHSGASDNIGRASTEYLAAARAGARNQWMA